jgi:phage replication O-like protein O
MENLGLPKPNYTQTPNIIFDEWLPHMKAAELKVVLVICRKTFGWHKEVDKISLSQLQAATGLSRQGVINGVNDAIERGIVLKIGNDVDGYSYQLIVNDIDQSSTGNDLTGQYGRPALVNEVDQASQRRGLALVNEVDTQKKGKETIKRNKMPTASADAASVQENKAESRLNGATPTTLSGWLVRIEAAKNPVTELGEMAIHVLELDITSGDKKVFGRIAGIYNRAFNKDATFMASKIWAMPASNPIGDKLDYLSKMKSSNGFKAGEHVEPARSPEEAARLSAAKRKLAAMQGQRQQAGS